MPNDWHTCSYGCRTRCERTKQQCLRSTCLQIQTAVLSMMIQLADSFCMLMPLSISWIYLTCATEDVCQINTAKQSHTLQTLQWAWNKLFHRIKASERPHTSSHPPRAINDLLNLTCCDPSGTQTLSVYIENPSDLVTCTVCQFLWHALSVSSCDMHCLLVLATCTVY